MDIEKLKELKSWVSDLRKFGVGEGNEIIALIDEAIARQSVKSEDVAEAIDDITERIEWECTVHGTKARRDKLKMYDLELQALRQYQKPTDEAVQRAIDWLEAEKESAQNDWERAGAEWRMEPGTQAQHDERMAAFDLAIQALRQMKPSKWIPVSERLPEPITKHSGFDVNNVYLVATFEGCNPNGYFYGYELARYWKSYWSSIDGSRGLSVTHWMPLPKPPESEG